MVLCVETRVRWIQKEGYHIEDLVLITDEAKRTLLLGIQKFMGDRITVKADLTAARLLDPHSNQVINPRG